MKRLEQQLLARMVAQMKHETIDPTVKEHADNVSHRSVESEENDSSKDWIGAITRILLFLGCVLFGPK